MHAAEDLLHKIAITHIPMVGAVTAKNLVSYCGGARAVFEQKKSHLLKIPGVGPAMAASIVRHQTFEEAESELTFIEKHGIKAFFYLDKEYPFRLKRIKDAPVILYHQGQADLNHARTVAIVGTRNPTSYGISQCEKLVDALAALDVLVVSGLAYGIDITAHRRSLSRAMATVGVLGSGLDVVYPAAHRKTARDMMSRGGLLTEFGHGTGPDRENFPMRNRVIAGLCDALVVVESDVRGGSMITADLASGYHKDVFALPGKVGDRWSRGCNLLIKNNVAQLLESGEELATIMHWDLKASPAQVQTSLFQDLSEEEQLICHLLEGAEQISIDRIYNELDVSASQIASLLLALEFKGAIRALPGKMYRLN